jgi:hypothetical protein
MNSGLLIAACCQTDPRIRTEQHDCGTAVSNLPGQHMQKRAQAEKAIRAPCGRDENDSKNLGYPWCSSKYAGDFIATAELEVKAGF